MGDIGLRASQVRQCADSRHAGRLKLARPAGIESSQIAGRPGEAFVPDEDVTKLRMDDDRHPESAGSRHHLIQLAERAAYPGPAMGEKHLDGEYVIAIGKLTAPGFDPLWGD